MGTSDRTCDLEVIGKMFDDVSNLEPWEPGYDYFADDAELEERAELHKSVTLSVVFRRNDITPLEAEFVPELRTFGLCDESKSDPQERSPIENLIHCSHLCTRCVAYAMGALRRIRAELEPQGLAKVPTDDLAEAGDVAVVNSAPAVSALPMLEQVDSESLSLVYPDGRQRSIPTGTVAWSLLSVLSGHEGQPLSIEQLAEMVDQTMWNLAGPPEDVGVSEDQMDSEYLHTAVQMSRRKTRTLDPYQGRSPAKIIEQLQSALRKATRSEARSWRDRWIHWDRQTQTVTYQLRA